MTAGTRPQSDARPRVVIIGSGFGGFFTARQLRMADLDVTVLAATDAFLYAPLLPDVAVGTVDARSVMVPLASSLPGVRVVVGYADQVDLHHRRVHYIDRHGIRGELSYDRLLLAPGSVTRLLNIPGLAEHAIGLKTATEALYLRDLVLQRLKEANLQDDPVRRRAMLTFTVVGAGYAGVELTAQMARLTAHLLPLYPKLPSHDIHWLLVDVADAVMSELGRRLGESALTLLRRRNVDVRLGVSVTAVTDTQVTLSDGTTLDCSVLIWCARVTGNPLIADLGLPTVKGRLTVDEFLQVPGHPQVYPIGDAATVADLTKPLDKDDLRPVCPPTAQHAMRQATAVAGNIRAGLGRGAVSRTGTATSACSSTSADRTPPPSRSECTYVAGSPSSWPWATASIRCRR